MAPAVKVGTILIEEWPLMEQSLSLESEPYSGNWSVNVRASTRLTG